MLAAPEVFSEVTSSWFFPLDECFLASSVQFFSIHSSNFIREKVGALHKAEIEKKKGISQFQIILVKEAKIWVSRYV